MKKFFKNIYNFFNNRYLILSIITILIAIIYIFQLFNLQIIQGAEYREKSQTRMLRTETVEAARGEIYDRNGVVLATNKLTNNVEIYKVNVDVDEQNTAIATLITILESNGDKIYSTFPINDTLDGFSFSSEEEENNFKKEIGLKSESTFDDVINYYIDKYALSNINDKKLQKKIIMVKYEGNINGYSLYNSAIIAKDISQESVAQISERQKELYGIVVVSGTKRYYPNGSLAAHVIGYVSSISQDEYKANKDNGYKINDDIGKTGIEQSFEKYLKGKSGTKKVETDSLGNVISETVTQEPEAGENVTLTIDYRLQKVAEESLKDVIYKLNNGLITREKIEEANAGAVVVLDVNSGEVLAMASYPTYDLNIDNLSVSEWASLNTSEVHPLINRAIAGKYAPGSTFKMLVGIAGVKSGGIGLDEKYLDPGIYPYGHKPKCWKYSAQGRTHGYVDLEGAIKGSCNCYFYEVGRRIGIDKIVEYAKLFGLNKKTGIELYGEKEGQIAGDNLNRTWQFGETLSAAIGQSENAYTPIELANYIATLANGGKLNKVSIVKSVKSEDNTKELTVEELNKISTEISGEEFEERTIDIGDDILNAVKQGMLSVTTETGGTANIVFKNSDIQVAGKTGTSQLGIGVENGLFVGFAPYDNPKIAVVAIIEHGDEGTYTANVVKPIMEEYFKISNENSANEKAQNAVKSTFGY